MVKMPTFLTPYNQDSPCGRTLKMTCFIALDKEKKTNKNALCSVESRLLGDKFYWQLVLLCYFFVWNTKRVLYVIM